jgi:hypothetical protein
VWRSGVRVRVLGLDVDRATRRIEIYLDLLILRESLETEVDVQPCYDVVCSVYTRVSASTAGSPKRPVTER